jgi:threonine aldolase
LFGEAVVITKEAFQRDFRYIIKQNGGMLSKGRLLGIQFEVLFADGLYDTISKHAVNMAMMLREAFAEKGYSFRYDSQTNQQFPILPNSRLTELSKKYAYSFWERIDDNHSAVRFCTSWATKREDVEALIRDIRDL